ncbi:NAD/NADP octopine/nopaline dehydrogenase family protein [Anaerovorax odorimutans]|uniref:NAD/NADP octopine/nopaline dehydrogenase family protein n=1 Tax=Anaerovorax odorimutans TaxID=109327 RepID=A0ABT1RM72_9FIRM|nr:NAD/NADP-dependent octopine/nopaline dehydrogenase family protein [Anaerovorax odorimutans]MCQ4636291.1 NAD/NADP octopine/nopaline dehydrogenase family protein [Anaerovorax odorimutans]
MKVAVLGAGNGGQTMAADLTLQGHRVSLYEMPEYAEPLRNLFETREITLEGFIKGKAKIDLITTDIAEAIEDVEIMFIPLPASAQRNYAELLADQVKDGQVIVLMPGSLGSLTFKRIFKEKGVTADIAICETSSLAYDTRAESPGRIHVFARNPDLLFGVMPTEKTDLAYKLASTFYSLQKVDDVLACGLHSLNPVLHIPGCVLNSARIERSKGDFYLYEEGITPCVAGVMEKLEEERKAIVQTLGYKFMSLAEELAEGRQPRSIWEEVNGCETLEFIKGPTSLQNRYFTEDIPYGLTAWIALAELLIVEVPVMKALQAIGSILIGAKLSDMVRTQADMGVEGLDKEALKKYVKDF